MSSENKKKKSHVTINGGGIYIGGNVSGSNIVTGDNNRINIERNAVIRNSEVENAHQNKKRLISSISQSLNASEISKISFELGIDYDKIETKSKVETVSILIETIEKQELFPRLLQLLKGTRPDVFDVVTSRSEE